MVMFDMEDMPDQLLTDFEVAKWLQVTRGALARWRMRGIGPPYIKASEGRNAAVRYSRQAVEEYLERQTVRTGEA